MIEQLSPLTRKIVALGLAIFVLLLLVQLVLLPLIQAIADQREELASLRARRARLETTVHRLMPDASTMPLGLGVVATDPGNAGKRLQALLSGSAAMAGVTLTQGVAHPLPMSTRILGSDVVAIGTEAGITNFVSLVEHGSPAIRFQHWRLAAGDTPTTMRFDGYAVTAWQPAL